ncbi:MAG: adenosine deaminase [Terracidiphilus sp.]|jgi:adenosine deaminase
MRSLVAYRLLQVAASVVLATLAGCGQKPTSQGVPTKAEARTALIYEANLHQGPETLRAFLSDFPKGADLHVHLSGAVYAETFIRDAAEDGLCVDKTSLSFAKPPCRGNLIPATELYGNLTSADQALYDKLIDSFSLRSFVATSGWSGHDQFFATFGHFDGPSKTHEAEWIDEVASRAAEQNNQYLELMETPPFSNAKKIAGEIGWNAKLAQADPQAFAEFRQQLLDRGLRDEVTADRNEVLQAETGRKQMEHCGTPQAAPACQVQVRYIYQVLRANAPEQVFAQTLLGFEAVQASMQAKDDTWVGINLVQPEDDLVSMRDYTLQMKIVGYFHSVYPEVHISLHAGELAPGMVPPEGLRFHIRQAIELGDAERIGHGVDVMVEDRARDLLTEMAARHIMVEINLSSNEGILGVEGNAHPFPVYRAAHVPVALSTDDEGVSRIDLTHEYVRAAIDYGLSYRDLKQLARTGMDHDFLPGASLWASPDDFRAPVDACKGETFGADNPSSNCKQFLDGSQKAAAQWELERRFTDFEAKFQGPGFDRLLHGH